MQNSMSKKSTSSAKNRTSYAYHSMESQPHNHEFRKNLQGQIQDFWKGVHMYKGVAVCFADFTSFFLNIP